MKKAKSDIEQALETVKIYPLPKRTDYTIYKLRAKLKRSPRRGVDNDTLIQERWRKLYDAYPELSESAKVFYEGQNPEWYTQDMMELIGEGATPLEAYKATQGILN